MSTRSVGTEEGREAGVFAAAFWLARKEMRRAWASYPLGGLLLVLLGLFVVPSLSGVYELRGFGEAGGRMEGFFNSFFSDCLFLVICASLAVRVVFRGPAPGRDDFFARLRFFKKLPIPAGSLVGSRAVCMLFALLVNGTAFFGLVFFLSDLGELGASYLWFAGIWVGYGLLASGLYLLVDLTDGGWAHAQIYFGFAAALVGALALLEWTLGLGLVGRSAELAQGGYGALCAMLSVLAGGMVFALLAWATGGRLKRWDLSA